MEPLAYEYNRAKASVYITSVNKLANGRKGGGGTSLGNSHCTLNSVVPSVFVKCAACCVQCAVYSVKPIVWSV